MDNEEEIRRASQAVLPVHTLEDLSRANLGSTRVVRMVVNDEMADRAEEMQTRGQGGAIETTGAGAGEGNNPFLGEGEKFRREE
jgi:hypothetical protein